MTMLFCDLPHDTRFAFRNAIESSGGEVEDYQGAGVQVALPNPSGPFFLAMEEAGLDFVTSSLFFFPLGSDAPPEHLRHAMAKYGPNRSFWLYARFVPHT